MAPNRRYYGKSLYLSFCITLLTSLIPFTSQSAHAAPIEYDTAFIADGTAKFAATGNSTALRTFNAITIEVWIKPAVTCVGNILAKAEDYAIYCSGGQINYALGGTSSGWSGTSSTISPPTSEWHHIALTRAASTNTVKMYFDGQLTFTGSADGAGTSGIKSTTTTFLNVGARTQVGTYFNGAIDEVRIFNIARTEAEIASDMHTWGNLGLSSVVGYYDFNSVSGTTIENKSYSPDANSNLSVSGSVSYAAIESTTSIGDQRITKFPRSYLTSTGGWSAPSGVSAARALIIGGGGGGGFDEGGGGGAGGFIDNPSVTFTPDVPLQVTVGQGGFGATGDPSRGGEGQDSMFANLTAFGGGGGATSANANSAAGRTAGNGGSGGGGAGESYTPRTAGTGVSGQGFAGGSGISSGAGGGGGAAEVGNADGASIGGDGLTSNITGTALYYAGGGGGGNGNTASTVFTGGNSGGGSGGASGTAPVRGSANLGGGGGGGGGVAGGYTSVLAAGASGGAGAIIIRYAIASSIQFSNLSFSSPPTKGINTTISFDVNAAGSVQVFSQGVRIKNCFKKSVGGTAPTYSVTCVWKPAVQGPTTLKIIGTPTDSLIATSTQSYSVQVLKRSTTR